MFLIFKITRSRGVALRNYGFFGLFSPFPQIIVPRKLGNNATEAAEVGEKIGLPQVPREYGQGFL